MIRMKKESAVIKLAAVICLFAALAFTVKFNSYANTVSVNWSNLSIDTSGSAVWNLSYSGNLVVDKYELKLARKNSGSWNTNYRSATTEDNSYDFSFTSAGQYYFTVRAVFVGGDKSTWSSASNTVSVASADVSGGVDNIGAGAIYISQTGINGMTYYTQAGPGTNISVPTSTIGPGGNYITNNNYSTYGNTVYSNVPGYTYQSSNTSTPTITGNNQTSGWIKDGNKWRYRYSNGSYASNAWDRINDNWYYFDSNGYMATGWVYYNNNWYLCDLSGIRKTGWNMVNNKWYYLDGSGIMQTGYITVDGIKYFCDNSGARVSGGYNPDGHYFDESGVMIK